MDIHGPHDLLDSCREQTARLVSIPGRNDPIANHLPLLLLLLLDIVAAVRWTGARATVFNGR